MYILSYIHGRYNCILFNNQNLKHTVLMNHSIMIDYLQNIVYLVIYIFKSALL